MMYGVLDEVREKRLEEVRARIWDVYVEDVKEEGEVGERWRWRDVQVSAKFGLGFRRPTRLRLKLKCFDL